MDSRRVSAVGWFAFVVAALFYLLSPHTIPPPADWSALAVAVGRWPLRGDDSGVWLFLVQALRGFYGSGCFLEILAVLGALCAGLVSAASVTIFAGMIPLAVKRNLDSTRIGRFVHTLILVAAAAFVVRSDPLAAVAADFSPAALELLLLTAAGFFAMRYRCSGAGVSACAAAMILGVVSYESPIGLLVLALIVGLPRIVKLVPAVEAADAEDSVLRRPPDLRIKWRVTVAFVLGLAVAFVMTRAAESVLAGQDIGFDATLSDWASQAVGWASLTGFAFIAIFAVVPFLFARWLLPRATDETDFLPYSVGLLFAVLGIFAYLQIGPFTSTRFWNWGSSVIFSASLKGCVLLAEVSVFVWLLCLLAVELVVRRYEAILSERYQELSDERGEGHPARACLPRVLLMSVPILLALVTPLSHWRNCEAELSALIGAYVDEVIDECGALAAVFTEGAFDPLVEVKAELSGRPLQAVSMMGNSEGYARKLRLRLADDDETRALLTIGAAATLKACADSSSDRLTNMAVQVGLEMWKNKPHPTEHPVLGGVTARFRAKGADGDPALDQWAAEGVLRARQLAERFCACSVREGRGGDRRLWHALLFAQWRLSRMARLRSIDAAREVSDAAALARSQTDGELADRLEALNPEARKALGSDGEWLVRQNGMLLQPREWLRIGLAKADFALAKTYAEIVLSGAPEDAEANFAMGMHSLVTRNYPAAERFFEKCLAGRPTDVAVLNNLANVELELGKCDEALLHAQEAVRLHPEIGGAKRTLERAQDAVDARADRMERETRKKEGVEGR